MVRIVEKIRDFPEVQSWLIARGEKTRIDRLPNLGFIKEGIAACFVYHDPTSTLGFAHSLYSNPRADRDAVYKAFDEMLDYGIPICRKKGIEVLFFTSNVPGIRDFAKKKGFKQTDENLGGFLIYE